MFDSRHNVCQSTGGEQTFLRIATPARPKSHDFMKSAYSHARHRRGHRLPCAGPGTRRTGCVPTLMPVYGFAPKVRPGRARCRLPLRYLLEAFSYLAGFHAYTYVVTQRLSEDASHPTVPAAKLTRQQRASRCWRPPQRRPLHRRARRLRGPDAFPTRRPPKPDK
jgi:hypothetical protein